MKYLVDKDILNRYRKYSILGRGQEGVCFELSNGIILKLFYGLEEDKKIFFDNLKCDQIAYPIDVLYFKGNNRVAGYTMNYLQGYSILDGLNDDLLISDLKSAYINARLVLLKQKNIFMKDLCSENILYDKTTNSFNFIDTTRWYPKYGSEIENIGNFNWQIMSSLLKSIKADYTHLKENKRLNEFLNMYQAQKEEISLFIEFLLELEKDVSEFNGEKVKSLKDLKYK